MATQGLIVFDIGVLMGSRSPQVLQEMVDIHPGAKKVLGLIKAIKCTCPDPMCLQNTFQMVLDSASMGDKDKAAKFLEEAEGQEFDNPEKFREFYLEACRNTRQDPNVYLSIDLSEG